MFKTISENPVKPQGKYIDHKSLFGKATHFDFGQDNEMQGAKSAL